MNNIRITTSSAGHSNNVAAQPLCAQRQRSFPARLAARIIALFKRLFNDSKDTLPKDLRKSMRFSEFKTICKTVNNASLSDFLCTQFWTSCFSD
jgi:hypothetical protein